MKKMLLKLLLLAGWMSLVPATFADPAAEPQPPLPGERWLLIQTDTATLSVMQGNRVITRFRDIALGRRGPKPVHYAGDMSTPTGEFRIDAINRNSYYTLFFHLNYPTPAHAKIALDAGRISQQDYDRIVVADWAGDPAPEDTPLGGKIGIHGIGKGSLQVHRQFNWTEGCIALDNQQILDLAGYVKTGMRVVIEEGGAVAATPPP